MLRFFKLAGAKHAAAFSIAKFQELEEALQLHCEQALESCVVILTMTLTVGQLVCFDNAVLLFDGGRSRKVCLLLFYPVC